MCFMENQVLETWQKPISHFSSSASSYFCHCELKNKRKLCKAHFCVNTLFASHSSMKKQSACNSWNRVGGRPISPMPYSCFVFWIKLICCKLSDGINAETICMKSVVINRLEVRKFVIAKLQETARHVNRSTSSPPPPTLLGYNNGQLQSWSLLRFFCWWKSVTVSEP